MADRYKIDFVSPDIKKRFYDQLQDNKDVQKLIKKREELIRNGKYVQAMQMSKQIEEWTDKAVANYIRQAEREAERININKTNLPKELVEQLNILYITTFMAADIIESSVLDMNDALKKWGTGFQVEVLDEFIELNKKAKERLKYLQRTEDVMDSPLWATQCDNMYEMMRNKAKKILNS